MALKIAYIIHAYTQPALFGRLLTALSSGNVHFFVHIDKRVNITPFQLSVSSTLCRQVSFVRREKSQWGSVQCIKMVLNALQEAVDSNVGFDYFYLLSGQDYPIKSNAHILKYLEENIESDFVPHIKLTADTIIPGASLDRYNRFHFLISKGRILRRLVKSIAYLLPKRQSPLGYEFYSGEFYMGISRASAEYILSFLNQHPEYLEFFRYSYIPEEAFFQTLLCNRPLSERPKLLNRTLTFVDWSRPNKASPATLTQGDLPLLEKSSCLFARKFDEHVSADLLDSLDRYRSDM